MVDQAARELTTRYDFKGTNSSIELGEDEIRMATSSEDRLVADAHDARREAGPSGRCR